MACRTPPNGKKKAKHAFDKLSNMDPPSTDLLDRVCLAISELPNLALVLNLSELDTDSATLLKIVANTFKALTKAKSDGLDKFKISHCNVVKNIRVPDFPSMLESLVRLARAHQISLKQLHIIYRNTLPIVCNESQTGS